MRILGHTTKFGLTPGVALGLLLLVLLRIPSFAEPRWYGDEGIYAAVAGEIRHGEALYRDIWDNKPPLIYWLYLLAGADSTMFGVRLLNLLAALATAIGLYLLARQLITDRAALVALFSAVVLLGTPVLEGNISNGENFLLPLVVWGLYLGLTAHGSRRRQLLSGALFGLACSFKLIAILDFAGFMVFLVLTRTRVVRNDLADEQIESPWPYGAAFATPLLAISLLTILHGTFHCFMTATLWDMFQYVSSFDDRWLGLVFWPMTGTAKLLLFLCGIVLIGMNFACGRLREEETFVGLLFWCEYIAVFLSGHQYYHYLIQLVPGASLLLVMGLRRAARNTSLIGKLNTGTALILALYLALIAFSRGQSIGVNYGGADVQGKRVLGTIAAYYRNYLAHVVLGTRSEAAYQRFFNDEQLRIDLLGERLASTFGDVPRDRIYLYTNRAWSYPSLGLRILTPFPAAYHQYIARNGTARVMGSLQADPPELIVVERDIGAVFPELARFLARSYQGAAQDATYDYFLRTTTPAAHARESPGGPVAAAPGTKSMATRAEP